MGFWVLEAWCLFLIFAYPGDKFGGFGGFGDSCSGVRLWCF